MAQEFPQVEWDDQARHDLDKLLRLAVVEEVGNLYDWTTLALVAEDTPGEAEIVARRAGVVAGLPAARQTLVHFDRRLEFRPLVEEGQRVAAGARLATVAGSARHLLTAERTLLNILGHLSGVATLTQQFVDAIAGTRARIYDTRKTLPGWRRLEKYAVRQGGGHNHRLGLHSAVLIKDNHLAFFAASQGVDAPSAAADALRHARQFVASLAPRGQREAVILEIEVDSLTQLDQVLPLQPDLVLLDNMAPEHLRQAVARRDVIAPGVELEASGGVDLAHVRQIAESGVDRISVGALTHSAPWFDVGLDWTRRS